MCPDTSEPATGGTHGPVFEHLRAGGTVVTSNQRLSRLLREGFNARSGRDAPAWLSGDVLPVGAWLARCHEEATVRGLLAPAALLSSAQEQVVWERVIGEDLAQNAPDAQALMHRSGSARAAARAHTLVLDWDLPADALRDDPSPDVRAFGRWRERFDALCGEQGWITRAILARRILDALDSGGAGGALNALVPGPVMAVGFDAMAPVLRQLFDHPAVKAVIHDEQRSMGTARLYAAADPEDEAERAADWACARLVDGARRVAIVALDAAADARAIERALRRRLHPGRPPEADAAHRLFDISRGGALSDEPVIAQALRTLELTLRGLGAEDLGRWLLSPFSKGACAEAEARAALDRGLRNDGVSGWDSLATQRPDLRAQGGLSVLAKGLGRMRAEVEDMPRTAVLSAWAGRFGRILAAAGWPSGRTLDSREFQAVAHWAGVLDSLVSLEHQLGPVSGTGALDRLVALAREEVFQQRVENAPVQVLGVLEAAGMDFDALWIMGMSEDVWPPMPAPDPFLPREMQRTRGMPHASAERELDFARRITARLLAGAPEVVVSYPSATNDAPVRPSALVAGFESLQAEAIAPVPVWSDRLVFADLERLDDAQGPALDAAANSGGVALLQDQSACAFRAYAHHRLRLRPIEEIAEGPDARERGTLVHLALERFWQLLEGRSPVLMGLDEDTRGQRAQAAASEALAERREKAPQFYTGPIGVLEQTRLAALVDGWAAFEQQRTHAFTVEAMEVEQSLSFGNLTLRGRVDRVDRLDNGERLIIDYKTGRVPSTGKAWQESPPAEPQLPAYGVSMDAAGISYAQVRAGQYSWSGLAASDLGVKGIKHEKGDGADAAWQVALGEWKDALDGLARDFASGWAAVSPRDESVCEYCDLGGVCRVRDQP
ncbi:MAG: PD-(D/E)XK nuclease family protein [Gammaproteobacteria bacterium]